MKIKRGFEGTATVLGRELSVSWDGTTLSLSPIEKEDSAMGIIQLLEGIEPSVSTTGQPQTRDSGAGAEVSPDVAQAPRRTARKKTTAKKVGKKVTKAAPPKSGKKATKASSTSAQGRGGSAQDLEDLDDLGDLDDLPDDGDSLDDYGGTDEDDGLGATDGDDDTTDLDDLPVEVRDAGTIKDVLEYLRDGEGLTEVDEWIARCLEIKSEVRILAAIRERSKLIERIRRAAGVME